jgi:predicted small metal-binding protein
MLKKSHFKIIESYVFLGDTRYRVAIMGTNIIFNVKASNEEEALDKAYNIAVKMGLTDNIIEDIKKRIKALQNK